LKLEWILLGLINIHPSVSGYELKTIINKSTGYFFSASLSQIYPALKELTNQGLIIYEVEPLIGKQDRKVYSITTEGYQVLTNWLLEPLELEQSLDAFEKFLLKLTFMGILNKDDVIVYLKSGLKYFTSEKKRILDNNLSNEKAYLKTGSVTSERYNFLWSNENEFLTEDLDRKIEWIESLIKNIHASDY
jgi:PadR family transcriptional regulator, regulatory protein AphA